MTVDRDALAKASEPRGTRAGSHATRNPSVVNKNSNSHISDLRSESSSTHDNGQTSSAGAARARELGGREVRCTHCRRWTTTPILVDGGLCGPELLDGGSACADCAPAILRAFMAVTHDEHDDPRPPHLRFAPTHCRCVSGPRLDRAAVEAALRRRPDLLPPPTVPHIPQVSDARLRWVSLNPEVSPA